MQRSNQRHLVPDAPFCVGAYELKGIGPGVPYYSARNGNDQPEKLMAVRLRFPHEFFIDRIAKFWTFALYELESVLPDFVTPIAQAGNNAGRQRVLLKSLTPSMD